MATVGNGGGITSVVANGVAMSSFVFNGVEVLSGNVPNIVYMMDDFTGDAIQDTGGSNYDAALHSNGGSYAYSVDDRTVTLENGATADSSFSFPTDQPWTFVRTYDVVNGSAFKMVAIEYKGNGKANVRFADQGTEFDVLHAIWADIDYTPPSALSLEDDLNLPTPKNQSDFGILDYFADELYVGTSGTELNYTRHADVVGFDLEITTAGDNDMRPSQRVYVTEPFEEGKEYALTFNVSNTVGSPVIHKVAVGGETIEIGKTLIDGENTITFTANYSGADHIGVYYDGTSAWSVSVDRGKVNVVSNENIFDHMSTSTTWGDGDGVYTVASDGKSYHLEITTDTNNNMRPYLSHYVESGKEMVDGKEYKISFNVVLNSGTFRIHRIAFATGSTMTVDKDMVNGLNEITATCNYDGANRINLYVDGDNYLCNVDADTIRIEEVVS